MVIYLDQYRRAKAARQPGAARTRDEERMCVNGAALRGMAAAFCYRDPRELSPQLPDDLAAIDVEAFIDRVYGLASQI